MKTTIICPVDFTNSANNATEYAAKLAQAISAELMLFNVQHTPFMAAVSLGEGIANNTRESSLLASNKLKQMSTEINKVYKVPTTYEVDITTKSLAQTISSAGKQNTIIVMGTDGPDNLTQFFFGTNAYNVSKESECPLLIVPENLVFEKYKNVLYPILYDEMDQVVLKQFYKFVKLFDAQITFLFITREDTVKSKDTFQRIKTEIELFSKNKLKPNINRVITDNIDDTIDDFVLEHLIDLMVMEKPHRNVLEKLFRKKPLLATISAIANYPILVVHS